MVALSKRRAVAQVEIGGLDTPADESAEIEAGYLWRDQLFSAIRLFVAGYVDANGLKGYEACAFALTKRWGSDEEGRPQHGRPVSPAQLRAALADAERNYFRAEWLDWFACRSGEVADIMARRVRPEKTDRQFNEDLLAEIRASYPKDAAALERRARAR